MVALNGAAGKKKKKKSSGKHVGITKKVDLLDRLASGVIWWDQEKNTKTKRKKKDTLKSNTAFNAV